MNPKIHPKRDWHSEPENADKNETLDIGQPDPALHDEPASGLRITIYAVGAIVVLGLVLYGLNQPAPENVAVQQGTPGTAPAPSQSASPPQNQAGGGNAPSTTGAAPQDSNKPQATDQQPKPQANQPQQPDTGKAQ